MFVSDVGEFEFSSSRLQLIEFDEHLAPIRRGDKKKIDPRSIRSSPGSRIDRRDSEFFLQDFRSALQVGAAILHLLNALSKSGEIFCNGARTSRFPRGQNIQRNPSNEIKLEFLGILIWWHVSESRGAVRDSNMPKSIALHSEPDRYGRIRPMQQRREFAVSPPFRNGRARDRTAQSIDVTRGRKPFGFIRGREVYDGLSERTGHGTAGIVA